jgi:hypothetical protein
MIDETTETFHVDGNSPHTVSNKLFTICQSYVIFLDKFELRLYGTVFKKQTLHDYSPTDIMNECS